MEMRSKSNRLHENKKNYIMGVSKLIEIEESCS